MSTIQNEQTTIAVAELHHLWLTGLILGLVAHKGEACAAEFVFRLFREQHLRRFIEGLAKLGLNDLPHAVAAAQYHYFSNQLGGVKVEYFEEHSRKAWIRYPPPRWIWAGSAICAIPSEVNRAMLRAWHAHNGVSLENPRLGFACTGTTVDGGAGLEGYYFESERDLKPHERLQFRFDEWCPQIAPESLPRLDTMDWPALRQAKAYRNYAMEYVRNSLPLLLELLGRDEGLALGLRCGRQIGMQHYDTAAARLNIEGNDASAFANLFGTLLRSSGEKVELTGTRIRRSDRRLFPDLSDTDHALEALANAPYEGLLAAHNRFLDLNSSGIDSFEIVERFTPRRFDADN